MYLCATHKSIVIYRRYSENRPEEPEDVSQDRFKKLYEDGARKKSIIDTLSKSMQDSECTFHPRLTSSKGDFSNIKSKVALIEKGIVTAKPLKHSETAIHEINTFAPRIGRGPKDRKKQEDEPIGDYLYMHAKVQREALNGRRALKELEEMKSIPKTFIQEKSNQLVVNMRNATFKKLFSLLDSDQDGVITSEAIDLSRIE